MSPHPARVLHRIAPWSTTGIGSLPFTDPAAAARHALDAYELPFCPQLPRLEGDMVAEWLGTDPGRCGWSPQRDRERPVAWTALQAELTRRPPAHGVVKLQVTGPVTLARALGAGGSLAREIGTWLAANAAGQVAALRTLGLDTVLVVDEPALAGPARPGIEAAWDPLRGVAAAWGLHLCCAVPWDLVTAAEPDLVSFDLAVNPVDRPAAVALRRHAARGGSVAWGVLPAHRPAGPRHGYLRLRAALGRVHVAPEQSLLTAGCGTGWLSERREVAVATALSAVAASRRPGVARRPPARRSSRGPRARAGS